MNEIEKVIENKEDERKCKCEMKSHIKNDGSVVIKIKAESVEELKNLSDMLKVVEYSLF